MATTVEEVLDAREKLADEGEALDSQEVTLVPNGGSLQHTTPSYAVDRYDLEKGEKVTIHTLRGGLLLVELPRK